MIKRNVLPVVWLLWACAGTPPPQRVETSPAKAVEISLALETPRKDGQRSRAVLPGEVLVDGDKLAMKVSATQPAYVYLLRAPPVGAPSMLYPEQGDALIRPGAVLRVPSEGSWFEIQGDQGLEHVVLVASSTPLAQREIFAAQPQDKSKQEKKGDNNKRPPCDNKVSTDCNRGDEGRLWTRLGPQRVGVIRFAFVHRTR